MNNFFIKNIIENKRPCYFFSPHLDDAVLSCGNLLSFLKDKTNVHVMTLFTSPSHPPYSFSARRFLMHCNEKNAQTLFEKRKQEDTSVMRKLGVEYTHLGYTDGTWRRHENMSKLRMLLGQILPELLYQYPTFLHVKLGRLTKDDKAFAAKLYGEIKKSLPDNAVIFAPLGIGSHIDHILTRDVLSHFPQTIYWSDFPYNVHNSVNKKFVKMKRLERISFTTQKNEKDEVIRMYRSQISSLFPDGSIPKKDEEFFIPQEK